MIMKRFLAVFLMLAIVLCSLSLTAMAADADGWKKTSGGWQYIQGGKPVADKWIQEGQYWYYIGTDTYMVTNSLVPVFDQYDKLTGLYYMLEDGKMLASAWKELIFTVELDGQVTKTTIWLYADASGKLAMDQWKMIEGKWYYFSGVSPIMDDYAEIDGKWYWFKPSGEMVTGWYQPYGDRSELSQLWIYADPQSGVLATKWKLIDKKWYYFGKWDDWGFASFDMVEAIGQDGAYDYYAFNKDCSMVSNAWFQYTWFESSTPEWYYLGADGKAVKGWKEIGGKWFFFDPEYASMWTGPATIKGVDYRFGDNGAMITGWFKLDSDWYYYKDSGAMAKNEWVQINGKWYYFQADGKMISGGTYMFSDKKEYTFDANGAWVK